MISNPENTPVHLSDDIIEIIKKYNLKSSWVPPLNRWIVRSYGSKENFFWTSTCGIKFEDEFNKYCINNNITK